MAENTKIDDVENTSGVIENKEAEKQPEVKPLEVKPLINKEPEKKAKDNWLIKIKLLCDVYAWSELQKAWTVLELEKEELEKYAESFYKKV